MVYTGAAAYHFGNKINMEEALKEVPADALAMGNLDPVSLFKMSSPEEMKKRLYSYWKPLPHIRTSFCRAVAIYRHIRH